MHCLIESKAQAEVIDEIMPIMHQDDHMSGAEFSAALDRAIRCSAEVKRAPARPLALPAPKRE